MKLKDKILLLKRKYKHVTKDRCFYNDKKELEISTGRITTWSIVESESKGVFLFKFPFIRRENLTYKTWGKYLTKGLQPGHKSLNEILVDVIMGNISAKYNDSWKLIEFIGWRLEPSGIHKTANSELVKKSKTKKKRK